MKPRVLIALLTVVSLSAFLIVLDNTRAGPVTDLEKCAILLSLSPENAAEVLVIGSSRTGVAIDPVAMQDMLRQDHAGHAPSVERIAIPVSPLRPSAALLENYIRNRGIPEVVIYEPAFLSRRSVRNLEDNHGKKNAEQYIFTRDMSILDYRQILSQPSVAMPFSNNENIFFRIHLVIRGILIRSGMLIYEFFHRPLRAWDISDCDEEDWRQGGMVWPDDFQFSYASSRHSVTSAEVLSAMTNSLKQQSLLRPLADWQAVHNGEDVFYSYDFESDYRAGELRIFETVVKLAKENDIDLIVQPLTLYGTPISEQDRSYLQGLGDNIFLFDLYAEAGGILDRFWYNPAHVLPDPAGIYTTALTANYITTNRMLYRD